ncbi:hypothetical protein [Paractinoplanes rishiriensis]|uniref:Uncharacterized protein n=1 Tax=Paractinoplanes rishiriensis TaxID=1050105 RepID=A0A919MSD5_9ACTN|nr:hypothetical protein [Actinoplanes rishiriensis]GIE93084.1 hypothetical protein Ari01nite_05490 [Actinoplanes rishiriensis]
MTTIDARAVIRWHKPLLVLTGAMVVLALVTTVGVFADARILTGAPIWLKPWKFAVSFVLYAFTLAWMLSVLPRRSRLAEIAAVIIVAVSFVEMAIIVVQAARGTTSHYNASTPLNAVLFSVMGTSILVLFLAHLLIGVIALIQRIPDRPARYAILLGLGVSLLGMLAAVPMVTPTEAQMMQGVTGAHSVGVPDGGPGLPITGWSTTGGDLRIGHFVGLHALQALPLLAFLLARYGGRRLDAVHRARLILVAGGAYAVLVMLLTWQALRAQPLLEPDALTLGAFGALALASAGGFVLVLRRKAAVAA